jgi:hypothetical protein
MSKAKSKPNGKRAKARRKPQTMAMAVAEPRLRGSRNPQTTDHRKGATSAQFPQTAQIYEIMLSWSPWRTMLRQQTLLAQVFSSMLKAQQAVAQNWTLPHARLLRFPRS